MAATFVLNFDLAKLSKIHYGYLPRKVGDLRFRVCCYRIDSSTMHVRVQRATYKKDPFVSAWVCFSRGVTVEVDEEEIFSSYNKEVIMNDTYCWIAVPAPETGNATVTVDLDITVDYASLEEPDDATLTLANNFQLYGNKEYLSYHSAVLKAMFEENPDQEEYAIPKVVPRFYSMLLQRVYELPIDYSLLCTHGIMTEFVKQARVLQMDIILKEIREFKAENEELFAPYENALKEGSIKTQKAKRRKQKKKAKIAEKKKLKQESEEAIKLSVTELEKMQRELEEYWVKIRNQTFGRVEKCEDTIEEPDHEPESQDKPEVDMDALKAIIEELTSDESDDEDIHQGIVALDSSDESDYDYETVNGED